MVGGNNHSKGGGKSNVLILMGKVRGCVRNAHCIIKVKVSPAGCTASHD